MTSATTKGDRRWLALILLSAAQFIVVLDASIVNVALPAIQSDLHFSPANLQWVVNAYVLTFGGFLLLGGRMADLLGRRRVFIGGLILFAIASLAGGLATSEGWLIAARAVQGLGAAIVSPAALSIVTITFREGEERNKALGVWGAVAGAGGAVGVLLGGILTDSLGWEWVLFVNVPIALAVAAFAPVLLGESRREGEREGFDVTGAVTVTAGLALFIFTLVNTVQHGWGSSRTLIGFAVAVLLLVGFVYRESRARHPLIRLGIFRSTTRSGANAAAMLLAASLFAMFFFLSLYLQQVLGASAMRTGVEYLPLAVSIFLSAGIASALVTKVGVRPVLVTGFVLAAIGLGWFSRVSANGSYLEDVLFPSIIVAVGLGFSFVSVTLAATAGVEAREAGLASGLLNTSQQVGGAVGLAILATLATSKTNSVMAAAGGAHSALPDAMTQGFRLAFLIGACFAVAGALLSFAFVRPPREAIAEAEGVAIAA
jgi:EmrB/QacA subfamily drug resistance transporter